MLLIDKQIRELCNANGWDPTPWFPPQKSWCSQVQLQAPIIQPFSECVRGNGVISWGLTHAGYDIRLGKKLLLFRNVFGEVIDPKRFDDEEYREKMFWEIPAPNGKEQGHAFTIPPNCYALATSVEWFNIPKFLKGRCVGKSTLARSGILINTTPLEPGWSGNLTIEIGNVTNSPAKIYCMEGIAQIEFELLNGIPDNDYESKGGIYQGQTDVTPARVKK